MQRSAQTGIAGSVQGEVGLSRPAWGPQPVSEPPTSRWFCAEPAPPGYDRRNRAGGPHPPPLLPLFLTNKVYSGLHSSPVLDSPVGSLVRTHNVEEKKQGPRATLSRPGARFASPRAGGCSLTVPKGKPGPEAALSRRSTWSKQHFLGTFLELQGPRRNQASPPSLVAPMPDFVSTLKGPPDPPSLCPQGLSRPRFLKGCS